VKGLASKAHRSSTNKDILAEELLQGLKKERIVSDTENAGKRTLKKRIYTVSLQLQTMGYSPGRLANQHKGKKLQQQEASARGDGNER